MVRRRFLPPLEPLLAGPLLASFRGTKVSPPQGPSQAAQRLAALLPPAQLPHNGPLHGNLGLGEGLRYFPGYCRITIHETWDQEEDEARGRGNKGGKVFYPEAATTTTGHEGPVPQRPGRAARP